jgi:thiol-disulfide isomerase/thioredoxin
LIAVLFAAVALAAASCGGERGAPPAPGIGATGSAASGAAAEPARADAGAATTPDAIASGPPVVAGDARTILAAVRAPGARATLVNVWATWCQPCRAEFPDLMRIERAYRDRGLRFVLVSADFDSSAPRAYLAGHGVRFGSWFKEDDDQRFIDAFSPQWSGALPATFVYDAGGRLVRFWEGRAEYAAFDEAVQLAMAAPPPQP